MVNESLHYADWREKVVFSAEGPRPQVLFQDERVKVVVAGLEAGQRIPPHAEVQAVLHCLEGAGWIVVNGERLSFNEGATVIVPQGASRGVEAESRLAFLAVRLS